ncbi:MAG: DUF5667 domain-containing protein [Patescibacteria group bacterium]|nr:DUF5667 domain-containing protein [Patescibacteria group bacterium]
MSSNIEKKLKETAKTNPLTKAEKNTLWAKIETSINKINVFKPSIFVNLTPKFIFALLMIVAVIGASAATVVASNDAGPGDLLYPIDLAIERVRIALSKEKNKDNLRLKFAQERLMEAQRALTFQNDNDSESITISTSTENNFKRIKKANKVLPAALKRLEKTKDLLERKGNGQAAEYVDDIIEKLTDLAENYVSDLDDFEMEIENGNGRKLEIKNHRDKIKVRFKLNHSKNKGKVVICHIPPDNPGNAHTIEVAEPAALAHLDHGDYLDECENGDQNEDQDDNDDDNNTTSTLDITAPVVSNISSSVSTNTADISWNTDEESDSVVWYSTTTPLIISNNTLFVDSSNLVTTHSISLSNLNSSTTYYFIVSSFDSSGNKATSTESSFTTLTPDTTAPIISSISSSVSTNTADIIWETDEESDSVVWYSTTTPLIISNNTLSVDSSDLVTDHTISLLGLNASTTHYFIISSSDISDNEATSTESSFTTL